MKIEFRKVPFTPKPFQTQTDSVKFEGTFYKISSSLLKIDAVLSGILTIICDRCTKSETMTINEKTELIISDGVYKEQTDDLIIEIESGMVNFNDIIQSELASIKSDYHLCNVCQQTNETIEKEF